jgi:pimeloyl-ACP methyl ester carboxylesterase
MAIRQIRGKRERSAEASADVAEQSFGSARFDDDARLDLELPDFDWSVLPAGVTRTRFTAPSGSLSGLVAGEPSLPRVLLVPGATGSKEDFLLMMPLLAAAGFRVESYDLAGQYESADAGPHHLVPPSRHYEYDLFLDDLITVLEAGGTPVHVLGYSFAGIVAQLALARRPELFASLALLSCPPEAGFRSIKRVGWAAGLVSDRMAAALMIWGIRLNVIRVPPGRLRFARQRFRLTRRESVDDIIGLMRTAPELTDMLAKASIPKLVAVGEHDLWPLSLHAGFARAGVASLAVYRSGHNPCESSPHQLCRDLIALYRKAGDPPPTQLER